MKVGKQMRKLVAVARVYTVYLMNKEINIINKVRDRNIIPKG